MTALAHPLKRVYWESTAGCNLRCIHCRRLDVLDKPAQDELTTAEAKHFIADLRRMGRPVFIFSGGEPLVRADFFELAAFAREQGLPIALATNGTLVDAPLAKRLHETGIYYASVSLDGAKAETHDLFRGQGAFEKSLRGIEALQGAGIKVQINFTVTRKNVEQVPAIYELARQRKCIALYLFLLVPVGCGVEIAEAQMLGAEQVDEWLLWVCEKDRQGPLPIKAICAPQYYRVEQQVAELHEPNTTERKGFLAGLHMAFVSHRGDVFPCGYLPVSAGNVRQQPLQEIWERSPVLRQLRDPELLQGRCGACEYKVVCGGCRARGFFAQNDVLAEEPYCRYVPPRLDPARAAG